MPKQSRIVKAVLYICAAIAIFILHARVMPYVGYVVGGVILIWSLDEIVERWHEKRFAMLSIPLVQIVIAVLLCLASKDIVKVCVIWGVWSVIRESREMTHALDRLAYKKSGLINTIESVVVIVMSALMILEPGEHHAHVHIVLLGIELILEILFPLSNEFFDRYAEKKGKKA